MGSGTLVESSGRGRVGEGGGGPSLRTLGTVGGVGTGSTPANTNQPIRECQRPAGQGELLHCSVNVKQQRPLAPAHSQTQAWWTGPSGRQSTTQQTFLTSRRQSRGRTQQLKTNQKEPFFVFFSNLFFYQSLDYLTHFLSALQSNLSDSADTCLPETHLKSGWLAPPVGQGQSPLFEGAKWGWMEEGRGRG